MTNSPHLRKSVLFILCPLIWVLAGCGITQRSTITSSADINKVETSTRIIQTAAATVTPSPLPTEYYYSLTTEADPRLDSYLLLEDIDPEIAQVIQYTLGERLRYTARYGKQFTSFVLLQPLQRNEDGQIKAFLYLRSTEFYVEGGELIEGGGGQTPAAMTLKQYPEGWHVEVETPMGGDWGTRLKEIFPEEVLPLLTNLPPLIGEELDQNIIQQAELHYGLKFNPEKNSFPPQVATPSPAVVLLTLTPTPTVDLGAITPNVRARSLVTTNTVSIRVNLYDGLTREFQKGLVSAGWHVYLFIRNSNEIYPLESGLLLDKYKDYDGASGYEFILQVPLEDILLFSGEYRGLVYQVVDNQGEVFWMEEIYLGKGLTHTYFNLDGKDFPNDFPKDLDEGLLYGTPNLMANNQILIFIPEDETFSVQEPPGGFFSLSYQYRIPSLTATAELAKLSESLEFDLYPYDENGEYSAGDALPLDGEISGTSGVLSVHFPHSWLDRQRFKIEKYLLIVHDQEGSFYKEVILHFKPYTSNP